jgi:predicted transcriptional regulator
VTTEETPPTGTPAATKTHTPTGRAEDTVLTASAAAPAVAERDYQRAFLLLQLQEARGGHLAKGKANRFPRAVQRELNLSPTTANALRDELVQQGYARAGRKGGSLTYEITDAGRDLLRTLPQKPIPTDGRPPVEREVSEEVRKYRRTFLLFQLFEAEGHVLEQKIINRFREPGRKFLDLRAPVANDLRKAMAEEGLLTVTRQGRNATYRLTAAGREELGATAHFPDVEIALSGRVLNELLEAARDSAKQFEASSAARPAARRPEPQPVHSGSAAD